MWFEHDEVEVHFSTIMCNYMNATFGARWIGVASLRLPNHFLCSNVPICSKCARNIWYLWKGSPIVPPKLQEHVSPMVKSILNNYDKECTCQRCYYSLCFFSAVCFLCLRFTRVTWKKCIFVRKISVTMSCTTL